MTALRFGGTSWVIPGSFAENLRCLSKDVSDMEIVLFDTEYGCNLPSRDEVRELRELCIEFGMSCTVHFPRDICPSVDAAERVRCEDSALRTLELFAPLEPFAWVLHLLGEVRGGPVSADVERWRSDTRKSAARVASAVDKRFKVCVETLDFDYEYVEDIVRESGFSVCLDVGHLIKRGCRVREQCEKYIPDTRVLHVHGVKPDGEDHSDLTFFDEELLKWIAERCGDGKERVASIEVFEGDYARSLPVLRKLRLI